MFFQNPKIATIAFIFTIICVLCLGRPAQAAYVYLDSILTDNVVCLAFHTNRAKPVSMTMNAFSVPVLPNGSYIAPDFYDMQTNVKLTTYIIFCQ